MRKSIPIFAFYTALTLLVFLSIAIAYKLVFQPPCTPTKNIICTGTDTGTIAALAGTVMGVAATILALLGAFAVAIWWTQLDERVNKQVTNIFENELTPQIDRRVDTIVDDFLQDQTVKVDQQVKALESTLTASSTKLQQYTQKQDQTIEHIDASSRALLYLVMGNRLLEQKKIPAAIEEFKQAKKLQPDDAQVNYMLGETYRKIGSYDKAIECLENAIAAEKEFALAHFELGMAYRSQADKLYTDPSMKQQHDDKYEEAIRHLKEATTILPDDEENIATLGGTYRRYGKYQDALECYHRALKLNSESSYALGNVALLSWHEGKLDDSREAFRRTKEIATRRIDSKITYEPYWDYYDLAMANLIVGQKDEALKDYQSAAKITFHLEHLKSVLAGLYFLKEVEHTYPIVGLNEAITIVESRKAEAESNIAKQTNP